ncbi:MAG TPA: asparagine synthase (glutamine-hydrolyzing) [Lacunisphaera sp.]|nr:asparagine synthase (glutamine-hydrolyzing) [Lacunisphaera sp.]
MCGIAGVISARHDGVEREGIVGRMIARQQHRGPDDEGLISSGPATIGMCRLSIIDPAHGHQPMVTPDGRFHIVFNGAIYNHRELRAGLIASGHSFQTNCDTEVLLAAYAQWGEACLPRLRGMFAFAVWDTQEHTLFAARDPLGIKPLYYAELPADMFVFASELNALLASGLMPREIDPVAVGDYLAWFAVPAPRTIYRGIANLPPGHAVKVDASGRCNVAPWWRLPESKPQPPLGRYEDFVQTLRGQLEDTIRAHRVADVPVGAFLSGGLDSTAIVALMSATGAGRLKTFSLIFNEAEYSEQSPARLAARTFGTEHHEEVLTGRQVVQDLPRILAAFDQPTGDGVNTYYVSRAAQAGGVKVALSGLGGDELFGGYPSFHDMPRFARYIPLWRQLPQALRSRVVTLLRKRGARARKLADFLEYARDLNELCSLRRRVLSESARLPLLAPAARRLAVRQGPNHPMLDDFAFELLGADPAQIVSAWEMRTYMADVLLRDSDVFSMSNSLELRVPFVDRVFVEWWWNQPCKFRYNLSRPKAALADAMADLVPASILTRRKRGFTLPFALWMRAELKPFLEETFSTSSLAACPWLDVVAVQNEWREFVQARDLRNWSRVWTLAVLVAFANRPLQP